MKITEVCAPILDVLASGPRDTIQIMEATRIPYVALTGRLVRLREAGLIHGLGRRRKLRALGVGYVMIWALSVQRKAAPVEEGFRVAGTITIGRGSNWKAGFM